MNNEVSVPINKNIDNLSAYILDVDIKSLKIQYSNPNKIIDSLFHYNPGVYMYFNDKSIYIGESKVPFSRLAQHKQARKIQSGHRIILIASKDFNASFIYQLETVLIDLFFASSKKGFQRKLLNKNLDQKLHDYFMMSEYKKLIKPIWNKLYDKNIVGEKYEVVVNNAAFLYSPYKKLNDKQLEFVNKIRTNLKDGITVIKGAPGTGKSVLATKLYTILSQHSNVALTSSTVNSFKNLEKVGKLLKNTIQNKSDVVKISQLCNNSNRNKYDVVIVDEAHRLRRTGANRGNPLQIRHLSQTTNNIKNYNDELSMLISMYKKVIIMYDENQKAHAMDIQRLENTYKNNIANTYELTEQMRCEESMDFVGFITDLLDNKNLYNHYNVSKNYDVQIFDRFSEMYSSLKILSNKHSLVRLLSGYTRKWISKKDPTKYDFNIDGIKLKWNQESTNWVWSQPAIRLEDVAYYHFIQGLDLNYCGVIIGKDLIYRNNKIVVDPDYVVQAQQRPTKDDVNYDKELLSLVVNRYKILLSRAAKGIYLYIEDARLREYFKSKINLRNFINNKCLSIRK